MKLWKPIARFVARSLNLPLDRWEAILDARNSDSIYVSEHGAWNQATVFACVRLLQHDLSRHPIHVYRRNGDNVDRQRGHRVEELLRNPNPIHTGMQFRGYSWGTRLTWGNSYFQKMRGSRTGNVKELWPLDPARMVGVELKDRRRRYTYQLEGETREWTDDHVLHDLETTSKDGGVTGVSPIRQLTEPILAALYAERQFSAYVRNYARPNLLLKHPSHFQEDDDRKKFLESIKASWGGRNAMGIGLLEDGLDVVPLSIPQSDAMLLEMRRFQKEEIAQVYNVPLHRLNDQQQRAQTSVEQNAKEYVEYVLAPLATSFEQTLEKHLLTEPERRAGFFIRHNLDALMRGQFRDRMEAWTKATGAHPMSINEARAKEDLPAIEGGNRLVVPGNMAFLNEDGSLTPILQKAQGSNANAEE